MSEITKIINKWEKQKHKQKQNKTKQKQKQTKTEKNKGDGSYSDSVRAKWFCCAFMLGFLQIIFPLTSGCSLPIFTANETITNLTQYQPICLYQVYTFQCNQIKSENPKSSITLKRFIVCL